MRSRTNQTTTTRRAVLTGATIATAAGIASTAAMRSTIASAVERDPILDLVAEADRLLAEAKASGARQEAIREAAGGLLDCGLPQLDLDRPEFEQVRGWLLQKYPDRRVPRVWIEQCNAELGAFGSDASRIEAESAARLAHWDTLRSEYERLAESSGYRAAIDRTEALYNQYGDVISEIAEAEAVTVEGAMAQLAIAARGIVEYHTLDGQFSGDVDDVAVLNAYEALARLLGTA